MAKAGNQNARTHGLTARNQALSPEDAASLQAHIEEYFDHFAPEGPVERDLVRQIAKCQWRLDRISDSEIATGYNESLSEDSKLTRQIDYLGRHEARLHRIARDARKELAALQECRIQQEAAWQNYENEQAAFEEQSRRTEAFRAQARQLTSGPPVPPPDPPSNHSQSGVEPQTPNLASSGASDAATSHTMDDQIEAAIARSYDAIGLTLADFHRHEKLFGEQEKCKNETGGNKKTRKPRK